MTDAAPRSPAPRPVERLSARALLVGERIATAGLERTDVFSTSPLAFRVGEKGFAAVFRYGVVVTVGLGPVEEDDLLRGLQPRITAPLPTHEEEALVLQQGGDGADDKMEADGAVRLSAFDSDHLLVVADVLAKSTALAHDERQVAKVFDTVEPWARTLAETGRRSGGRKEMLKLIGSALLVQHRVSERVAVRERPDALWDRPDLDRLYSRLEDEYELIERADALNRKIEVIGDTAARLTDLIDAQTSLRLEAIIVALIVFEIVITLWQLAAGAGGH